MCIMSEEGSRYQLDFTGSQVRLLLRQTYEIICGLGGK